MPTNTAASSQRSLRIWEIAALVFAGLGTLIAAAGLWAQVAVNKHVLDGLAFERVEALRGSGVNVLKDWSHERVVSSGVPLSQWSLKELTLINRSEENTLDIHLGESSASGHQGLHASRVHFKLQSSSAFNFSGAEFYGGKVEGNLSESKFENAVFRDVEFKAISLSNANFRDALISVSSSAPKKQSSLSDLFGFKPGDAKSAVNGTDFRGADFRGLTFKESEFSGSCYDETTHFKGRSASGEFEPAIPDESTRAICQALDNNG